SSSGASRSASPKRAHSGVKVYQSGSRTSTAARATTAITSSAHQTASTTKARQATPQSDAPFRQHHGHLARERGHPSNEVSDGLRDQDRLWSPAGPGVGGDRRSPTGEPSVDPRSTRPHDSRDGGFAAAGTNMNGRRRYHRRRVDLATAETCPKARETLLAGST